MADAGVLGEDDRVELLEGEIIEMAPIGSRHNACVDRLVAVLQPQLAGRAILRVQGSIGLSARSEPQPDVAVLRSREDFYADELPGPDDVLLIVEVAETSADTDRNKARSYGQAGIVQAWVVDLAMGELEDGRGPTPEGYADLRTHSYKDRVALAALADVTIDVARILS
jgi:Uma2 family endonuclease